MANLIIYRSDDADSLLGAATALNSAPSSSTLHDTADETLTTIGVYIGTLVAGTYAKIYSCVNDTRVEEVVGTAIITVNGAGGAAEIAWATVTIGANTFPLGAIVSAAAGVNADAVLLTASINAGTARHGFSAVNTGAPSAVVTISAPAGTGALANAYALGVDEDSGGTLDLVITSDFAALATGVTAVGNTGDMSQANFVSLELLASGAPIDSGTATAGAGSTITLAATAVATNDYYLGMYVNITGGTGANQARRITGYVGATLVATVDSAWGTNPDNTSTYTISDDVRSLGRAFNSMNAPLVTWLDVYSNNTPPKVVQYVSGYNYPNTPLAYYTNTAQAGAATTITLAAGAASSATDDFYNGMYIGIKSGTGPGQVRKITDYNGTTKVATVSYAWGTNPGADSVYQIAEAESGLFRDVQFQNYALVYLNDLTDSNVLNEWKRLLDAGRYDPSLNTLAYLSSLTGTSSYQDLDFMNDTVLFKGDAAWRYTLL